MLAWSGDFDPGIEGHGTLTASNVVGQGVINGMAPSFARPATAAVPGAVLGGAPNAKLAPFGDIYFGFDVSTQFGYFLVDRAGVDVTSNSYGNSDVDNDGYDAASQEADIIHATAARDAAVLDRQRRPGFGTTTPPSPATGMTVGASTQFGATGWDSIKNYSQVVDNDVIECSNRGPGATGTAGVDIVADGAYSSGDMTLNTVLDGAPRGRRGAARAARRRSRPAPRRSSTRRGARPAATSPARSTVRATLKSSAKDLGYDSLDAGRRLAQRRPRGRLGRQGRAGPCHADEWRPATTAGGSTRVFSNVIAPGGSDTQKFNVDGRRRWKVADR